MIVKLQGGLGNQMFQYAYGISRDKDCSFDTSLLGLGEPKREYQLDAYVQAKFRNDPSAQEGYWQSEKYFDVLLVRNIFARPNKVIPQEIYQIALKLHGCCFIGVRRSDYLLPDRINFHGVMPVEYYEEAKSKIPKGTKFVCFSDDPEWAKKNLGLRSISTFSVHPAWDIWLMSLCTHAIIANSTFHWWGAWLGPDRKGTVIAPKKWFMSEKSEIVPERWITI